MFNLVQNIDFVIASMFMLVVISVSVGRRYSNISKSNKAFYRMVHTLFFACICSVLSVIGRSYPNQINIFATFIFRLAYIDLLAVVCALSYQYVRSYQDYDNKHNVLDYAVMGLLVVPFLVSFIDIITIISTNGSEDTMSTVNIFLGISMLSAFIILILIAVSAVVNKRYYSTLQFKSIITFTAIIIFFVIAELIFSNLVLGLFGLTLAIIIIQSSLETPDYSQLNQTAKELSVLKAEDKLLRESNEELTMQNDRLNIDIIASREASKEAAKEAAKASKTAEEMRRAAVLANQSKDDFFAKMSTEFRTPISTIMNINEHIYSEANDETIKEKSKEISEAANHLLSMFNDVFDYNKIENNTLKIKEEEYELVDFVKDIYKKHIAEANSKKINFIIDIDENIPKTLVGDSFRLSQVIDRMISEDIKHVDMGSVTFKMSLEGMGRASCLIKYVLKDTGMGIKEEDIKTVYERMYPADEANDEYKDGVGLGLSIVSKILNMMGTRLNMDSVYGVGTYYDFSVRQSYVNPAPIGKLDFGNED